MNNYEMLPGEKRYFKNSFNFLKRGFQEVSCYISPCFSKCAFTLLCFARGIVTKKVTLTSEKAFFRGAVLTRDFLEGRS